MKAWPLLEKRWATRSTKTVGKPISGALWVTKLASVTPKKVGTRPVEGSAEDKQTNEIKIAAPLLDTIEIKGRTITADALLTQCELARYLVERGANYPFTTKGNQPKLLEAIAYYFEKLSTPADFIQTGHGEHGRLETRKIGVTTKLNGYLDFPPAHQAFMIARESIDKKSRKESKETVYGITSVTTEQASPEQVLGDNRAHWRVESCHYIIDWTYDEACPELVEGTAAGSAPDLALKTALA